MSSFFTLDEMTRSRQYELRQEAKYAVQLRGLSSGTRAVSIKSRRKLAVTSGMRLLLTLLAALSSGAVI